MKNNTLLIVLVLVVLCGCSSKVYSGPGYNVHDEVEARNFAWFWFKNNDYNQAKKMASVALDINQNDFESINILGLIEMRNGNYEKASHYFIDSIKIAQNQNSEYSKAALLNNLGFAYFGMGQFAMGLENFNMANKINDNWSSKIGKILSYYSLNDIESAEQNKNEFSGPSDIKNKLEYTLEYFNLNLNNRLREMVIN